MSEQQGLFGGVLRQVARGLAGDRPLLLGLAGVVVVGAIGLATPGGARLAVFAVAGVVLVLCLARIVVTARVEGARARRRRDNVARLGADAKLGNARLSAPGSNEFVAGDGLQMKDLTMTAGVEPDHRRDTR
ncbi:hypothetical protein Lfu02_37430 [Longispora fulva]|uniref:Uncharacterized protein n=1 Tax=Longispora fulva TaxID=619741 RepID=A0A8J7KKP2_9ACTN|nr:hypothetical protein [Longispora fulva]MBG6141480.1 hypothetical protein [Longispora fulva]GIG59371.1 hypothetical protein Lfu02_37430 [Longispora fulva]